MTKGRTGAVLASRSALVASTRADRKRRRAQLGALCSFRVAKTTERRYAIAYGRLCVFAAAAAWLPIYTLLHFDRCCAAYVEACWEEGEPVNWALMPWQPLSSSCRPAAETFVIMVHVGSLEKTRTPRSCIAIHGRSP